MRVENVKNLQSKVPKKVKEEESDDDDDNKKKNNKPERNQSCNVLKNKNTGRLRGGY